MTRRPESHRNGSQDGPSEASPNSVALTRVIPIVRTGSRKSSRRAVLPNGCSPVSLIRWYAGFRWASFQPRKIRKQVGPMTHDGCFPTGDIGVMDPTGPNLPGSAVSELGSGGSHHDHSPGRRSAPIRRQDAGRAGSATSDAVLSPVFAC